MEGRINEEKYEEMIAALHMFATNIYTKASELQTVASVAASVLGNEDTGIIETYKKIKECQLKYCDAVELAKSIANTMQMELDDARKEREVWTSEDD